MKNLLDEFQESIKMLGLTKKDRLLIAVSGGLDSVVLTYCAAMSGLDFAIAHANFMLRGPESERDENFVISLAAQFNKPVFTHKFDTVTYAEKEKLSIQVAARNLRYNWFNTLLGKVAGSFRGVLTAHHLDDNTETMLMHFFRGTGIAGLAGMPVRNEGIFRPFLSFPKSRLLEFAVSQKLEWVEDSSNETDDYTRNFLRNKLIPAISAVFPEVRENLGKNLRRFDEANMLYQQAITRHKKKLLKTVGKETHIPILLLKKSAPLQTIVYEIIRDYHFSASQTAEIIRLMESSNGKYVSSPTHQIIKNRRWLIIAPLADLSISHFIIDRTDSPFLYPEGRLQFNQRGFMEPESVSDSANKASLDAEKIQFPLILRKWKTGDYFYPLGMKKKKKLARFFIDQKLSKSAKENVWVLLMDSQVVWVVGHRIDDRFSIRESTKNILVISKIETSSN
jgi:tRNA(Ile)-lysidine synthase